MIFQNITEKFNSMHLICLRLVGGWINRSWTVIIAIITWLRNGSFWINYDRLLFFFNLEMFTYALTFSVIMSCF